MKKINGKAISEAADYDTRSAQLNFALVRAACNRFFESRGLPIYDFAGRIPKGKNEKPPLHRRP